MKVELETGVWLSGWADFEAGDPPRTLKEGNAYEFATMTHAKEALKQARIYHPFENAVITDDLF